MQRFPLYLLSLVLLNSMTFAQDRIPTQPNTLTRQETRQQYELLFDGKQIDSEIWQGANNDYKVVEGTMVCDPGGIMLTKKEYKDFVFRCEFKLPPGGNNGIGIRTKMGVRPSYNGGEIQILDDQHEKYKTWLKDFQRHGALYGAVPPLLNALKPTGEWNTQEVIVYGNKIRVTVNQQVVLDTDITDFVNGAKKPLDDKEHIFNEKGLVGFLGHNDPVVFRTVRIKEIQNEQEYERLISPRGSQ